MFCRTSYVTIGTAIEKNYIPFEGICTFIVGRWMMICSWSMIATMKEKEAPKRIETMIVHPSSAWMRDRVIWAASTKLPTAVDWMSCLLILDVRFFDFWSSIKPSDVINISSLFLITNVTLSYYFIELMSKGELKFICTSSILSSNLTASHVKFTSLAFLSSSSLIGDMNTSIAEELRFDRDVIFILCENSIFIRPIGFIDFILADAFFGMICT